MEKTKDNKELDDKSIEIDPKKAFPSEGLKKVNLRKAKIVGIDDKLKRIYSITN